jgi:hypothetical protein
MDKEIFKEINKDYNKDNKNIDNKKYDDLNNNIKKWVIPFEITENEKKFFYELYMKIIVNNNKLDNFFLMNNYVENLLPHLDVLRISKFENNLRDKTSLSSGFIFLFYMIIYKSINYNNDDKQSIYDYVILYILMDKYIDDITIDNSKKTEVIKQMAILIYDPYQYKNMKLIDPILKNMAITYIKLIKKYPNIKKSFINLFNIQIKGHIKQKSNTLSREEYYDLSVNKGIYTNSILCDIFEIKDEHEKLINNELGVIAQLIDECDDVEEDINSNIYTIATYDLDNIGYLDNIIIDIMERIDKINNKYLIYKILATYLLIYIISKTPKFFSKKLGSLIKYYDIYTYIRDELKLPSLTDTIINIIQKKIQ